MYLHVWFGSYLFRSNSFLQSLSPLVSCENTAASASEYVKGMGSQHSVWGYICHVESEINRMHPLQGNIWSDASITGSAWDLRGFEKEDPM